MSLMGLPSTAQPRLWIDVEGRGNMELLERAWRCRPQRDAKRLSRGFGGSAFASLEEGRARREGVGGPTPAGVGMQGWDATGFLPRGAETAESSVVRAFAGITPSEGAPIYSCHRSVASPLFALRSKTLESLSCEFCARTVHRAPPIEPVDHRLA